MCSCVVTVAAATQDTAEWAVVAAVGVAAESLNKTAGANRNITREPLRDCNHISADSICAAAW